MWACCVASSSRNFSFLLYYHAILFKITKEIKIVHSLVRMVCVVVVEREIRGIGKKGEMAGPIVYE